MLIIQQTSATARPRLLRAVRLVAQLEEAALTQAGLQDGLQELLGDDHVRVHVLHVQGRRDAGERRELRHAYGQSANEESVNKS